MKKINVKKVLLSMLLTFIFVFRIWQTTGCLSVFNFKFNPSSISTIVESQRLSDTNQSSLTSRIIHNKLTVAPSQLMLSLSSTLTPKFLIDLVGPLVLISALIAIYLIIKTQNKGGLAFLVTLACFQVATTLFINSKPAILILCALWFFLAFWSLDFYVKKTWMVTIFIFLWLYSFWFLFINWQMPQICNEIFFN